MTQCTDGDRRLERSARTFFHSVCDGISEFDGAFVVIAHMLPSLPPYLEALERIGQVACVIPKPKSVDPEIERWTEGRVDVLRLGRDAFQEPIRIGGQLQRYIGDRRFIAMDIGGYFASCINDLCGLMTNQCVGAVEDTENGHQRYENEDLMVPCVSVARSRLKRTEDRRVGEAIVFSAEALLRPLGVTIPGRTALVVGYGKIGQSIARELHARRARVLVADRDPCQTVLAEADGFTPVEKSRGFEEASLVFCATGNHAIAGTEWDHIAPDTYVISATSADDELDLSYLAEYEQARWATSVTAYVRKKQRIFLVADGNAVNFVHNAEVRPSVYIVQAALLAGVDRLVTEPGLTPGIWSLDDDMEQRLAALYLASFRGIRPMRYLGRRRSA